MNRLNSLLNRTYVYQIFDGRRMPSRNKLIAIAFGMRLSVEETNELLYDHSMEILGVPEK